MMSPTNSLQPMQKLFDLTRFDGAATADVMKEIGPGLGFREKLRQPVVSVARLLYIDGCPILDERIEEKVEPVWCQVEILKNGILVRMRIRREIFALPLPFRNIDSVRLVHDDRNLDHNDALQGMNWLTKPGVFFNPNDDAGWSRLVIQFSQSEHLHFKFQKNGFKRVRKFFSQPPIHHQLSAE